jgi:hypothetical protein
MSLSNIDIKKADNGFTIEASYESKSGKNNISDYSRKSYVASSNDELNTKIRELLDEAEEEVSPKSKIEQKRKETLKKIYDTDKDEE